MTTPTERGKRDAIAAQLAAGHAFTASTAITACCAVCGAHADYHTVETAADRALPAAPPAEGYASGISLDAWHSIIRRG